MGKKEDYKSRTGRYLPPLMDEHHLELVDVEYVREVGTWYLRTYIDKEGGIAVDDCETISRKLGEWLDKEDFIDESYTLGVSSPGLGYPLKKERGFIGSMGKDMNVRLYRQTDKQKEFIGVSDAYDENTVVLIMEDGSLVVFEKLGIALMRLALNS